MARSHAREAAGLLCLAALTSGCFSVVTTTAQEADRLAAAGQLQRAEEAYARASGEYITQDEWDYIFESRCDVRTRLLRAELDRLKSAPAALTELREWRTYARKCPSFVDFEASFDELIIAQIERTFAAELEPMIAGRQAYEALTRAAELTVDLPEVHPRRAWLAEERARLGSQMRELTQTAPPVTAGVARRLLGVLGEDGGGELDAAAVDAQVQVALRAAVPISRDASCAGAEVPELPAETTTSGTGFEITRVHVRDCQRRTYTDVRSEEFTEFETRLVQKEVEVAVEVPLTRTTTTYYRTCNSTGYCYPSGSSTSSTTQFVKTVERRTITVEEKVPVQVTRRVKRGFASRSASIELVVSSPDGQRTETLTFKPADRRSEPLAPDAPDTAAVAFDNPVAFDELFRTALAEEVRTVAAAWAKGLRHDTLRAQARDAFARGDERTGRELALTMALSGATLDDELAGRADAAFFLDVTRRDLAALEPLPVYAWAPDTVVGDLFTFAPETREFEGVVRFGYPYSFVGVTGAYAAPETFVGQPDRSALQLDVSSQVRWSLMSGRFHRGVGLMVGFGLDMRFGRRLGEDYVRVQDSPYFVDDEEEPRTTFGLGTNVLGSLGVRTRWGALFAGVRPQYHSFKVGYFFSAGGTIPLTARLEARWVERYPVVIEGWWGDVTDAGRLGALTQAGLTADLPLSRNLWLRLSGARHELPANFFGLWEQDDIYVERAHTDAWSAGVSYSF